MKIQPMELPSGEVILVFSQAGDLAPFLTGDLPKYWEERGIYAMFVAGEVEVLPGVPMGPTPAADEAAAEVAPPKTVVIPGSAAYIKAKYGQRVDTTAVDGAVEAERRFGDDVGEPPEPLSADEIWTAAENSRRDTGALTGMEMV